MKKEEPKEQNKADAKNQPELNGTIGNHKIRMKKKRNERKSKSNSNRSGLIDGLADTFEPGTRCGTSIEMDEWQMHHQATRHKNTKGEVCKMGTKQTEAPDQRKPRVRKIERRKGKVEQGKMTTNARTKNTPHYPPTTTPLPAPHQPTMPSSQQILKILNCK